MKRERRTTVALEGKRVENGNGDRTGEENEMGYRTGEENNSGTGGKRVENEMG